MVSSEETDFEDDWRSPSSIDDSADSLYVPETQSKKNLKKGGWQPKCKVNRKKVVKKHRTGEKTGSQLDCCDSSPSMSAAAQDELDVWNRLKDFRGEEKRGRRRKSNFFDTVEPEPFRVGVADLPEGFGWTDKEPPNRPDFFSPNNNPGDLFNGEELCSEVFLALHELALQLLLKAMNETGKEFVQKKFWKMFKEITRPELLRFHSILLFSQVVKISRLDEYWKKNSIFYQPFVARQMSFKRFKVLKRCVRCYMPSEASEIGTNDPNSPNFDRLYKIMPMQDALLRNYRKFRFPCREVTIDEQMVKFKVGN